LIARYLLDLLAREKLQDVGLLLPREAEALEAEYLAAGRARADEAGTKAPASERRAARA